MNFQLSSEVDSNKVFLVKHSELEGRLDPSSYSMKNLFLNSPYPLRKLRDYFLINPSQKDKIVDEKEYPFLPMENISEKDASIARVNSIKGHQTKGYTSFNNGDLIFSKITPCMENGKMAIVKGLEKNWFGSTEFHVFREKSSHVTVSFLRVLLLINNFRRFAKCNFTGTAGHQRVPPEFFYQLKISIPPKEIQSQIVAKMDATYTAKKQKEAEAQRLLDSIDDYLLGQLGIELPKQEENTIQNRMFTRQLSEVSGGRLDPFYYQNFYEMIQSILTRRSDTARLTELLQFIGSGNRPKGGVGNIESGVLSFGGEHINNSCELKVNKPKYISQEFHDTHRETETRLKDLLLVKDGATTGKIGIIEKAEHVSQNINEHLFILRTTEKINPVYLVSYLNSYFGQIQIKREITGGTVTGITRDVLLRIKVVVPNLKKQTEIADHISKIRNQAKALQQQAKEELEQAKKEVETMILGADAK